MEYSSPFGIVSQLLDAPCYLLLPNLFSVLVSDYGASIIIFTSSLLLLSAVLSILMCLSKTFFISIMVILILISFLWLFLTISISLLKLPIWVYMLSTFFIWAFNIWFTVILNFLCDICNICVVAESGSEDCFIFKVVVVFMGWFAKDGFSMCAAHLPLDLLAVMLPRHSLSSVALSTVFCCYFCHMLLARNWRMRKYVFLYSD